MPLHESCPPVTVVSANDVVDARVESTHEERARRLSEITGKYRARHRLTPYRLHLLRVPVLRLALDVRRGERRYPLDLDWLLPAEGFAPLRYPACAQSGAPLVAAKTHLESSPP